jgi:hypothetical protein
MTAASLCPSRSRNPDHNDNTSNATKKIKILIETVTDDHIIKRAFYRHLLIGSTAT